MQVKIENKKRKILSSSIEKLQRKDKISQRIKNEKKKKKKIDLQKKEQIEIRLRTILNNQKQKNQELSRKLSRVSSRYSNSPQNKKHSSFSERRSEESPFGLDFLKDIHEKMNRSRNNYEFNIRETVSRIADHNDKVEKTLISQKSIRELTQHHKMLSLIEKIENLDYRKMRKKNKNEEIQKKKYEQKIEKHCKVKEKILDEEKKTLNKINKLENKQILQKNILMCQLEEMNKEKEYNSVRKQLRGDDTRENLERSKKNLLKKRDRLLEKYLETSKKIEQMKEEKERNNEKIRFEAIQAKQEIIKAKEMHLMINRSDDPNMVMRIIEKKF